MARRTGEGVRIGPITLLTLVSVLLLAVLAMLCVTTTHATEAMTQRQPRWSSTVPTSCWKTPPRQAAPATCGPSST